MEKKKYDYYVIHLCKDTDRINNVNMLSKKIGKTINIFKGIDASTFKTTDYSSILNNYSNDLKINMKPNYPGIVGCYLSHYLLYKQLETTDLDYAVILEDDSNILIDNINEKIDTYLNMNKTFDFLFLGYNPIPGNQYDDELYHINNKVKVWGFHGYIINIKSIPKILENNNIINFEIDIQIFNKIKKNIFTGYFIYPKLINQHKFKSLIRTNIIDNNINKKLTIVNKQVTNVNKQVTNVNKQITNINKQITNVNKQITNINKPINKLIIPINQTKLIQKNIIKLLYINKKKI